MSSSFHENFQRQESEKLEHDDNAFNYFLIAFLTTCLIPMTYLMILRPMLMGEMVIQNDWSIKNCQCKTCVKRMGVRNQVYRFAFINHWFLVRVAIVSALWMVAGKAYIQVKDIEPLKGFVPHELLGVAPDASISEIKKAFRRLSRQLHPDKNPDNPKAVSEFLLVTKAHAVS